MEVRGHGAEEFHARLEQIRADRTKGTRIRPAGVAKGPTKHVTVKGIGLSRRFPLSACEESDGRIAKKIGPVLSACSGFGWRYLRSMPVHI